MVRNRLLLLALLIERYKPTYSHARFFKLIFMLLALSNIEFIKTELTSKSVIQLHLSNHEFDFKGSNVDKFESNCNYLDSIGGKCLFD